MNHKPLSIGLLVLSLVPTALEAVQTIPNPLIKPAALKEGVKTEQAATAGKATEGAAANNAAPSEDLKRQAERRLTQEDLNIRQQQLNQSQVPQSLLNLFDHMVVVAYYHGAVVLRKSGSETEPAAPEPPRNGQPTPGNAPGGTPAPAPQAATNPSRPQASVASPSLRLQVGRVTAVNGYKLRASALGQEVSVDWQDDAGRWVNVYVGVLQSSSGYNPVPRAGQLEPLQTSQFNYLKPHVGPTGLGGTPGAAGNGFGQAGAAGGFGGGGFGSSNVNGFGQGGFPGANTGGFR